MTALFRAPDTDSRKPRPSQPLPILQKKEEPASPIDTQSAEMSPSTPVTPVRSNTVARKVVAPSMTASKLQTPNPSNSAESAPSNMPDPVWNRLQTIFRKHQEQGEPPAIDTKDMKIDSADSLPFQAAYEEKVPEAPQAISTKEPSLLAQNPMTANSSTTAVQRSSGNVEGQSPNVLRKAQQLPTTTPTTASAEVTHTTELEPTPPDKTTEVQDKRSADDELEKPSLPLESAWNVQRVETSHPLIQENTSHLPFDSRAADKNEISIETAPVPEQRPAYGPIQLHQEDGSATETQISDPQPTESHEPVEILAPSRPRPPQTNLPTSNMSIQRQSQEPAPSKEISESAPVNTVIGPLPADLWWLLGQKPPAAESQPDIQRTVQPEQKQTPLEQNNPAKPRASAEHPAETPVTPTHTIQRQVLSNDPLPSSLQEPVKSSRAEESRHAETLDLDDLARRVYAEVRRRLAAEWERRR